MSDVTPKSPRQCLHITQWPEVDQLTWVRVNAPGDVLDEEIGRAAGWRAPTREKVRKGYGRWNGFLYWSGMMNVATPPCDRITRDAVQAYVLQLQGEIASWTIWTYLVSLHQAAMCFDPDRDWDWLYRLTAKLHARRKAVRQKLPKLRPSSEIANWAYTRMDAIQAGADRRPSAAITYRDALLIGLLINCPMRLRNLAMIRMEEHLRRAGSGYVLDFKPEEIKTNRHLSLIIPEALTPYLQTWIDEWRPILLTDPDTASLWLGIQGRPLAGSAIYWRICKTTARAFGAPINPHLFRDCAVTTIAIEDPEHIGITAPILGHINSKTTQDHYIHANQVMAGRRYRNSVDLLRQQARDQIRRAKS